MQSLFSLALLPETPFLGWLFTYKRQNFIKIVVHVIFMYQYNQIAHKTLDPVYIRSEVRQNPGRGYL